MAEWEFSYEKPESKKLQKAVNDAAKFLTDNRELFPDGYVPISSSSLAAVAIRVHPEFINTQGSNGVNTPSKMVKDIVAKYP
ncbi:hypothetical protein CS022_01840 [Veronia nyctiphanis]|uniref:Uncharacterized protein n=1 Tax=Veronia nyctiphanis TaxID=1278244 RepID=A0A4Q0YVV5_9GAMM|nr:hypothetical protein [Veronia nyctiphanis]RXJ74945.1 hypothetical protein CS022_01840 [Veronia nyctiphanis]